MRGQSGNRLSYLDAPILTHTTMRIKSKEGVSHWVDGSNTWMLGFSGFLLRIRGLITTSVLIPLPLAGVPFWWPETIPEKINVSLPSALMHSALLFLCMFIIAFFYVRGRTSRSLSMKAELHHLMHDSRDALGDLLKRIKKANGINYNTQGQHERKHIKEYSKNICEIIAAYFSVLMNDNSIGCAIRMGIRNPEKPTDEIKYVTIGRSSILNRGRENSSEPVARSAGIPAFFLSEKIKCNGVLFYDDLIKAASNNAYVITDNDRKYPEDIGTMIVAPINGWNGAKMDLIGLFYLTSKSDKILSPKHVDLIKFTADHLAIVYSSMLSALHNAGAVPHLIEEEDNDGANQDS